MFARTNGVNGNPQSQNVVKQSPKLGGARKKNGRHIRPASSPKRLPSARQDGVKGKSLFSRKVVWLEKIKHHWNIFACNARLTLGLYSDFGGRKALKDSIKDSELELKLLRTEANLKNNQERLREALEDGEIGEALCNGAKVAQGYLLRGVYAINRPD